MDAAENPYAAPPVAGPFVNADIVASGNEGIAYAEAQRRKYLNHETSVKSISLLYFIGAFPLGLALFFFIALAYRSSSSMGPIEGLFALGIMGLSFGLLLCGGLWLQKLDPRARLPVGIVSGLGLLGVPFGTLINGYILYMVFGAKGKYVFSDEYREIIRQTPHIKYRTPTWLYAILIVVVVGIVLVVALNLK